MGWNWISQLEEFRRAARPCVLVTVTQCTGSTPREVGAKMLVTNDGQKGLLGTIGGGHLEQLAIEDALKLLDQNAASKSIRYPLGAKTGQCCGGVVELLFEVLNTGPRLYLFGAGHVGQAVSRVLSGTPFVVHVIDERPEWIESAQLPPDVIRHACSWEDFVDEAAWDAQRTYVAIMTFRHDMDEQILEDLLKRERPARYVGLIGSQSKWERFKQRLQGKGIPAQKLEQVHCPLGIPIGGKSPQEVAISLAAQLLKIHHG